MIAWQVGPPLGGWLFGLGGFTMPFLVLGICLLPAAALIYNHLPLESLRTSKDGDELKTDVSMRTLLRSPQVFSGEVVSSRPLVLVVAV